MNKRIILLIAATGLFLTACGSGEAKQETKATDKETTKIIAVGSTALQPLVEAGQEAFTSQHPTYQISVQGGGSGTGLSQVVDGSVTIGNSDVFAEEKSGIDAKALVDHKVAVVGMAPVINKEVGIKTLTQQQLIDVFTGKITNWKEVGGKDEPVTIINRAEGSGSRATFEKWGLKGAVPKKAQEQDSSGTVRQIVKQTPGAISYLAFSYFDGSVLPLSIDGVTPTDAHVATNEWKIWSYEHMYTKGKPDKSVQAFLDFMVSDEIQNGAVKQLGYLPITAMKVERTASGEVK